MKKTNFCKLAKGSYFKYCNGKSGYLKVAGKTTKSGALKRKGYVGGAVEMLLKARVGKKAPFYPVRTCSCVEKITRAKAIKLAEANLRKRSREFSKVTATLRRRTKG